MVLAAMAGGGAVPVCAEPQATRGIVTGRVTDVTGAVLQGAQIHLQPKGVTVASDVQGEFTIPDLEAGDYKLTVSYLGFKEFAADLKVGSGENRNIEAKLEVANDAQQVLVTADLPRGEAEAINRTRMADNILQVLPSQIIVSLPNANVADAVGRMPSVSLERIEGEGVYIQVRGTQPRQTNVTIDGVTIPSPEPTVRQIRLDVIPADLIESVELNKTLVPNIDGDGIGGSVNLRTKLAGEFPTLNLYGIGGYDSILGGRYSDQFGGTTGHRFGKKKQFGVLFGGSKDYNGRGIDNEQPALDPLSTFAKPIYDDNTIREYRYYRSRWGYTGNADWKIDDSTSVYFKSIYSNLKDYGDKWYYAPYATGSPKFYTSSKRPDASISSYLIGGRKQFTSSLLTWEASVARSYELDSAGNPKADFSWIGPSLTCGYDPTMQTGVTVPHFGNNCDGPNSPLEVAANWGFKDITTSKGLSAQLNLGAAASYSRNYRLGSHFGIFEFGFKVRNAHKYQDATENVYDGWKAASYPMTMFLSNFSGNNFFNGQYFGGHFGPVSDFNQLQTYTLANLSSFLDGYKTASDSLSDQYSTIERITSGYLMNTMDFGRWHIVAGVRIEGTQVNARGNDVTLYAAGSKNCALSTGCGTATPIITAPDYTTLLPGVSARYGLTQDSGLRFVYGYGISRPDVYQLTPYASVDDSTNPATVALGNTNLKPEHAHNFDALYEKYLRSVGILQAGFYYKQITDSLVSTTYTGAAGTTYAGDMVSQWINAGTGHLYGFEVAYQQRLTWLPGPLSALGILANYGWAGSSQYGIPGRTDHPTLQRQAPNNWNISPTYDRGRVSIRVGLAYNGPSVYAYSYQLSSDPSGLGPKGPSGDVYTLSHLQLDVQGSLRLKYGFTFIASGLNLTDEVFGYYTGSPIFVNQREYYKPTYSIGLRYTLNREK
jgi:TonB-dependent receptor